MPTTYRNWCGRALMFGVVSYLFLPFLIMVNDLYPHTSKMKIPPPCITKTCFKEAHRISHQINLEANPCEDLLDFVCGESQRKVDPVKEIQLDAKRQIIHLYKEPSNVDEHSMVTVMKKLFKACVTEMSNDPLSIMSVNKILKDVKLVGGWPLLEGSKWDETKFNWMHATHKFRDLGYYYESFLNISVVEDPFRGNKNLLKLSLPIYYSLHVQLMLDVVELFGIKRDLAYREMVETYEHIRQLCHEFTQEVSEHTYISVESYQHVQREMSGINWLLFINEIIKPAEISKEDILLIQNPEVMAVWYQHLSGLPKKIQANYMIWKVIEDILVVSNYDVKQYFLSPAYKELACLETIQNHIKTFPNPIDIVYVKKYLTDRKIQMVRDIVNNVKYAFRQQVKLSEWLNVNDKVAVNSNNEYSSRHMIIGAPHKYFEDGIFDEIQVDMEESNNDDFLSLLLQIKKNYNSLIFQQIYNAAYDSDCLLWNLLTATENSLEYFGKSVITLPATILQGAFFNEDRPNYLNYGSLGTFVAAEFACEMTDVAFVYYGLSEESRKNLNKIRACFLHQVKDKLKLNGIEEQWDYKLLHLQLSTNISYLAYQNWVTSNKAQEAQLANTPYTNHQLFWISAASFYCQYPLPTTLGLDKYYSFYVSGIAINSCNFAADFNCHVNSNTNPIKKCFVL